MTRPLDQSLLQTVYALIDGLEHANVRYCLIGALVPELLLKTPPPRRTNDADAVVQVETLEDFERVKNSLELKPYGFVRTPGPFRMERGAGKVDVLPYSEALAPDGLLRIPPSTPYNMLGFDKVYDAQTLVPIDGRRMVPLVTIPLYVLLKTVAYSDRRAPRDPASVLHCLLFYEEDSERLYGVEHEGALVDFDIAGAYLLGIDGRALLNQPLANAIRPTLLALADPESPLGFQTIHEYRGMSDDRWRSKTARLFRAYLNGLGL